MTLVERLRRIAEQYKCPWGDPGSNPDYFSMEDYNNVREAADEIERLRANIKEMAAVTGRQLDERNAEIERWRKEAERFQVQWEEANDEIERLWTKLARANCPIVDARNSDDGD